MSSSRDRSYENLTSFQIDVTVNAPKAGTITELLAQEEDTVAVGQDLFKLEPGEPGAASAGAYAYFIENHNCVY